MDIKSKWKEIAIVLLILSNLFLMHSISRIRNDVYYLDGTLSSLEGNLENLKNDVSYLERKADNNTSDIESIYGILQDMEHSRLFGFWNNKSPHAHRRGGFNILHQLSFSISPCIKETISQSSLSSLILSTNASAITFGPMSLFTIRTPSFRKRMATELLTYIIILIQKIFTLVLILKKFCKQKTCTP